MSEKPTNRHIEPFVNEFGDTINPGDEVYAVTVSTHRTHVSKGRYIGVSKSVGWRGQEIKRVQLEVEAKRSYWVYKDTGERVDYYVWYRSDRSRDIGVEHEPYTRITTLQRNRIMPINISTSTLVDRI